MFLLIYFFVALANFGLPLLTKIHNGQNLQGPIPEDYQTEPYYAPFQKIWVSEDCNFLWDFPFLKHRGGWRGCQEVSSVFCSLKIRPLVKL